MVKIPFPQNGQIAAAPAVRQNRTQRMFSRRKQTRHIIAQERDLFAEIGPAGSKQVVPDLCAIQSGLENTARGDMETGPFQLPFHLEFPAKMRRQRGG